MSRSFVILAGLVVLAVTAAAGGWWYVSQSAPAAGGGAASGAASAQANAEVEALGTLEPNGGLLDLGATAGDRVAKLLVEAGQSVEAGQPLVYLASYDSRETERRAAELALADAKRRQAIEQSYGDNLIQEAELGVQQLSLYQLDVDAQAAKIGELKADLQIAQRDYERMEKLDASIVSPQEREHQKLLVDQAQAELTSATALLAKAKAAHEINVRDAQQKLAAAKINRDRLLSVIDLDSLAQQIELARSRLELAMVRAPAKGQILEIVTRIGETVGQAPVLRMGDTAQMYAVAEVYESQVWSVKVGQRAKITSDALLKPLEGTVDSIGTVVAKNDATSLNPTRNTDLRVVKVRVKLDSSGEAARMVNLQVTVTIDTSGK